MGLDPRSPGSRPELKAGAKTLSHPGIPRFYLFIHEMQRKRGVGQRHRQREKKAPCREPDVGLDPRSPGSCPGPKAGAKPLRHPGIPFFLFFFFLIFFTSMAFYLRKNKKPLDSFVFFSLCVSHE